MRALAMAILAGFLVPHDSTVRFETDVVEINRFYDCRGTLIFEQVIWWEWAVDHHRVRGWKLSKECVVDGKVVRWNDGGITVHVRAKSRIDSWSQVDPERKDLKKHPESKRTGFVYRRKP